MIGLAIGHEVLSFMDCTARHNQILMLPENKKATAFHTPKGISWYKMMPFEIKNVGATY